MWATLMATLWATAAPVALVASDGLKVGGESWGKGTRGVVLVHGDGRSRADWSAWGPRLAAQGMAVVAPDVRGHGATSLGHEPNDADWAAASRDVAAAVQWLRTKGARHVSVVGVDVGGNLALAAASAGGVDDLAWVAPRPSAHGMTARLQMGAWPGPILLIATQADALSARTADLLGEAAQGAHYVLSTAAPATGVGILDADPDIGTALVSWLNGTLLADAEAALRGGAPAPKLDAIEATGKTLEGGP